MYVAALYREKLLINVFHRIRIPEIKLFRIIRLIMVGGCYCIIECARANETAFEANF